MKHWTIQQAADVSKLMVENPYVASIGAVLMYMFGFLYGDSKMIMTAMALYTLMIALDWLTGTSAAKKYAIDTSEYGKEGFKRTIFMLAIPVVARILDEIMGTGVIISGFAIAGLSRGVAKSVLANTKRAGWDKWMPEGLIDWISDELANKEKRAQERWNEIYKREHENNE